MRSRHRALNVSGAENTSAVKRQAALRGHRNPEEENRPMAMGGDNDDARPVRRQNLMKQAAIPNHSAVSFNL
ncbi:hypothetical protein GCK72_025924 [Caenorhabditis remanei]|uniref:Uncharacterized protein n=1 Tax=Caenorhabditis remanei TaxID=31234 RepID=A0A6A5G3H7_CAERE|nr:hypothetical protein GCK72_025924 [Caenorhabditis remanei]KAF1749456.1 hypothetical protein GCK72_025924 [Caenorhabditis remanei]